MSDLDALNAYEEEGRRLNAVIERLGREVAAIADVSLQHERYYKSNRFENYTYDSYERVEMCEFYDRVKKIPYSYWPAGEDEDYNEVPASGERLIVAKYGLYIGDGYDQRSIYFPETYLDDPDWQVREQGYADERRAKAQAIEEQNRQAREDADRAKFEALKARFEPSGQ